MIPRFSRCMILLIVLHPEREAQAMVDVANTVADYGSQIGTELADVGLEVGDLSLFFISSISRGLILSI